MSLKSKSAAASSASLSAPGDRVSRRHFQVAALAGAAGLALPAVGTRESQAANEPQENEPKEKAGWIDAHVHVWTPDTERYPISPKFKISDMQPPSFTPEQLFAHCKPEGVNRIVLIQMSFYEFDNRYMLDSMAAHPGTFSGVAIVDSNAPDVAAKIKALAAQGVRGLRIHPGPNEAAGWVTNDGMATVWKTARAHGVAVCPLINPTDLPHVDAMCAKFPGTRVVVDHFARIGMSGAVDPDRLNALCRLARYPDVYVKTSAFYALGKKQPPYVDLLPMIRRLVDTFGVDRLMWASDCPYQVQGEHSYAASIALIRDRAEFLSAGDKQALLRNTAETVFFSS